MLTISDRCHAGTRVDVSGPAVAARLAERGFDVVRREVLADERAAIEARLKELAEAGDCEVIFTTGGTGVTARDITPEATRAVVEREIPGLGELMRAEGLKKTRRAALSRATAGTLAAHADRQSAGVAQGRAGVAGCYRGSGAAHRGAVAGPHGARAGSRARGGATGVKREASSTLERLWNR